MENGAFYITSAKGLKESRCRLSGRIGICEMPEETYYEIDEPSDWLIIEHLLEKSRKTRRIHKKKEDIKLLITDCDRVLTDGGMYYTEKGDESKKFNTRDGMGLQRLKEAGIKRGIITGEDTRIVADRAAYIGDDCNDLECIRAAGLGMAVADAVDEVKEAADYVLKTRGGYGAVREAAEFILSGRFHRP